MFILLYRTFKKYLVVEISNEHLLKYIVINTY